MYDCVKKDENLIRIFDDENSDVDNLYRIDEIKTHFRHQCEDVDAGTVYYSVEFELGKKAFYGEPRSEDEAKARQIEAVHNYLDKLGSGEDKNCVSIRFEDKDDRDEFYNKFLKCISE